MSPLRFFACGLLLEQRIHEERLKKVSFDGTDLVRRLTSDWQLLYREYLAWTLASHPIVLRCLKYCFQLSRNPSIPSLVSTRMTNGTLSAYIKSQSGSVRLHAVSILLIISTIIVMRSLLITTTSRCR